MEAKFFVVSLCAPFVPLDYVCNTLGESKDWAGEVRSRRGREVMEGLGEEAQWHLTENLPLKVVVH